MLRVEPVGIETFVINSRIYGRFFITALNCIRPYLSLTFYIIQPLTFADFMRKFYTASSGPVGSESQPGDQPGGISSDK